MQTPAENTEPKYFSLLFCIAGIPVDDLFLNRGAQPEDGKFICMLFFLSFSNLFWSSISFVAVLCAINLESWVRNDLGHIVSIGYIYIYVSNWRGGASLVKMVKRGREHTTLKHHTA